MNPSWKLFAVLGLAASFAPHPSITHAAAAESKRFHWLFAGKAAAALALNADASRLLDGTEPFVFSGLTFKDLPPGWKAIPVRAFKSFGDVRNALAENTPASDVRGVMYDYEKWRFTPEEEQKNPAGYVKQAADIVHAHGLLFFTAPAVDLAPVLAPSGDRKRQDETYLRLGIAADAARYADVVDIQSQRFERDTTLYAKIRQRSCRASPSGKSEGNRACWRQYSAERPVCNSQRHSAGYRRNSRFCRRLLAQHSRAVGIFPRGH